MTLCWNLKSKGVFGLYQGLGRVDTGYLFGGIDTHDQGKDCCSLVKTGAAVSRGRQDNAS
jgi:hypothetical protein